MLKEKINLKTKSLYLAIYNDDSEYNFFTFAYDLNASDEELNNYFRDIVYLGEYGIKENGNASVDIYELKTVFDYNNLKDYRVEII